MVSAYLVHHGYSSTAESFAKATEQNLNEELTSIRTRQSKLKIICSMVVCGITNNNLFDSMQKF